MYQRTSNKIVSYLDTLEFKCNTHAALRMMIQNHINIATIRVPHAAGLGSMILESVNGAYTNLSINSGGNLMASYNILYSLFTYVC